MDQMTLDLAPPRRIDITLDRLDKVVNEMVESERSTLANHKWWSIAVIVSRLRAMERAEIEVLPSSRQTMADAYDLVVTPGEHPIEALLRTFRTVYCQKEAA